MSTETWVDAFAADELPKGDVVAVQIGGYDIAIHCVNGAVYATDNSCTHGEARLCDGFLDGYEIECPLHQGRFDVRDGRPLCDPAVESLRTYNVKIENARVYVRLK